MLKLNAIHKIINTISRATKIKFRSIEKNLKIRKRHRHFLFVLVCYCWYQPSKSQTGFSPQAIFTSVFLPG